MIPHPTVHFIHNVPSMTAHAALTSQTHAAGQSHVKSSSEVLFGLGVSDASQVSTTPGSDVFRQIKGGTPGCRRWSCAGCWGGWRGCLMRCRAAACSPTRPRPPCRCRPALCPLPSLPFLLAFLPCFLLAFLLAFFRAFFRASACRTPVHGIGGTHSSATDSPPRQLSTRHCFAQVLLSTSARPPTEAGIETVRGLPASLARRLQRRRIAAGLALQSLRVAALPTSVAVVTHRMRAAKLEKVMEQEIGTANVNDH